MKHLPLIQSILANNPDLGCRMPADKIQSSHRIRQDLGMDSLGLMGLLYELQEQFPHLEEEQLASWKTVEDILKSIEGP